MINPGFERGRRRGALRHPDFRLYLLGQTVSVLGTWVQTTALSWLVFRLTGSSFALGGVGFVALVPALPLALIGGSLADRVPKRNLLLVTTTIGALQAFALAALSWSGHITIGLILLLSFVLGACNSVETGTRQALVVEMVGAADATSGVAMTSASWSIAMMIGPAVAGVLLALAGPAACFLANGLSFLVALATLAAVRPTVTSGESGPLSVGRDLRTVGEFFLDHREARAILGLAVLSGMFCFSVGALLPAFAVDALHVGPRGFGALTGAFGVGTVVGALAFAQLGDRFGRGRLFVVGRFVAPLCLLTFALSRSYALSCLILVVSGAFLVSQNGLGDPLLQTIAPPHLRGRVMSIYSLGAVGMMRLGGIVLGAVADHIGAPLTLGISAIIGLAGCVCVWRLVPGVARLR